MIGFVIQRLRSFRFAIRGNATMLMSQQNAWLHLLATALVIGAETLTRFIDPEDRATAILLGDAAGAAVIGRTDDPEKGILYCELGCDGTRADLIIVPAGGARMPSIGSRKTRRAC